MKRGLIVVLSGILVGLLITAFAPASEGAGEQVARTTTHGKFSRYHVPNRMQESALDYWTPARMEAAEPRQMTRSGATILSHESKANQSTRAANAGYIEGVPPSGSSLDSSARSATTSTFLAAGYSYPFPFSRYEIPGLANYQSYPYSAIGKIFATDASGSYECSGAAVVSANESVVWTAGHCAHTIKFGWFTNLVFVPAYRDGAQPFGTFAAVDAWAPNRWLNVEDVRSDVAAIVVGTSTTGATLRDTVGALGFAWSVSRIQHWESFGYPAFSPFNGNRQHVCSASFGANDASFKRRPPIAIGCDMTPGSSGGPWILGFGQSYYLNGVNSYSYSRLRKAMFGPYFTTAMKSLLSCAEDGVC